jgi:hypothetical protein
VVVGTFAPDFEYFLRLVPKGHFGHTLSEVFLLDLPLSLIFLSLFHTYMRDPIAMLLPYPIQRRIFRSSRKFRFWGPARLALVIGSILVGIETHILWDSFTHPTFWLYRHWAVLSQTVHLPVVGTVQCYQLFQHGSTVAGSTILLIWILQWYRSTIPAQRLTLQPFSFAVKRRLLAFLTITAFSGAVIRAFVGAGAPNSQRSLAIFLSEMAVTIVTLIWLQLLAYGIIYSKLQRFDQQD